MTIHCTYNETFGRVKLLSIALLVCTLSLDLGVKSKGVTNCNCDRDHALLKSQCVVMSMLNEFQSQPCITIYNQSRWVSLQITRCQWIVQKITKHYSGADGLSEAQHLQIMRKCEDMLLTDPNSLLPEDLNLLDVDFESLGKAPAIHRQLWLSQMSAASNVANNFNFTHNYIGPTVDTEGSIR